MSATKSLAKTQWAIEGGRVNIYPYKLFNIFGVVLAVIFAGILVVYMKYENTTLSESLPFLLLVLFIVFLFFAFARTEIVFDNGPRLMQKKLMGFLPVKTIPFDELEGIKIVRNMGGGYNFRAFTKANRYGRGIIVSSGYKRDDDTNAVAFNTEALAIIDGFLKNGSYQKESSPEPITTYEYFTANAGVYTMKTRKIGLIIFGAIFFFIGIHECTGCAWIKDVSILGKLIMTVGCLAFGVMFITAAYTKVVFDTITKTVKRNSPIGIGNKTYAFTEFNGFQTVRKSINFIYAGTELYMYFYPPGATKENAFLVNTFKRSRQIERFIEEVNSIMAI